MNFKSTTKNFAAPLFVLALMLSLTANSSKAATIIKPLTDTTKDGIYSRVDVQPQFPGGLQAFGVFLGNNIKYPAEDAKKKYRAG